MTMKTFRERMRLHLPSVSAEREQLRQQSAIREVRARGPSRTLAHSNHHIHSHREWWDDNDEATKSERVRAARCHGRNTNNNSHPQRLGVHRSEPKCAHQVHMAHAGSIACASGRDVALACLFSQAQARLRSIQDLARTDGSATSFRRRFRRSQCQPRHFS